MKSLFNRDAANEIASRITSLKENSRRKWGEMDVCQMMAHCSATLEVATGKVEIPFSLMGKLIGRFFKKSFSDDTEFRKNSPTAKEFIITVPKEFEIEKKKLLMLINEFHIGGTAKCTTRPHSFFGNLTAEEWGKGMYKHLDHHLLQFSL